ncbi:MAG: tetratricopeptide repeat protein [Candidatus Obscuribacterales bacterium]|nr:tetratricopeptide repeat protein [Candidatus Obscuribacterales bacterium]
MSSFKQLRGKVVAWQGWFKSTVIESKYFKIVTRTTWIISACYVIYAGYQSIPYYTHISFGKKAFENGNYDMAASEFQLALEEAKSKHFSDNDPRLANTYNNLAEVYRVQGRFKLALLAATKAYELSRTSLKQQHQGRVFVTTNLASINKDIGHYSESERLYNEGLQIWQKDIRINEDSNLASIYNGMAKLKIDQGDYKDAQVWLDKAFNMRKKLLGENDHAMAPLFDTRGTIEMKLGNYAQADKDFRKAWTLDEAITGRNNAEVAVDLDNMGAISTKLGKYSEAEKFLLEADQITKPIKGEGSVFRGRILTNLGETYIAAGRPDLAIPVLEKALTLREQSLGKSHPYYAITKADLEKAYSDKAKK